jgi:hypothetical protein
MFDNNRLVALDGVGLIDKASIRQGIRKWSWVRCHINAKQMKLLNKRYIRKSKALNRIREFSGLLTRVCWGVR